MLCVFMARNYKRKSKKLEKAPSNLEDKAALTAAIIGLIGGMFFLSFNITGNAVGSRAIPNIIGVVFLITGLIACYFWVSEKKK